MHTSISVLLHSVNQPLFPREKFLQEPCPCEHFSSQTNSCRMVVVNKMGVDMTWHQKLINQIITFKLRNKSLRILVGLL